MEDYLKLSIESLSKAAFALGNSACTFLTVGGKDQPLVG
jgi:hypothetical protein